MRKKWVFWGILGIITLLPLIKAATTATTLFVWNVPAGTRSYTITYGASCSATQFYFNEVDANHDPDNDGNGARIPPTANLLVDWNVFDATYDYSSITAPSPGPAYGYGNITLGNDPTSPADFSVEYTSDEYINVATDMDALYAEFYDDTAGRYVSSLNQFGISQNRLRVTALLLDYSAIAFAKVTATPCSTSSGGQEDDLRLFVWNWSTNTFDQRNTTNGQQGAPTAATITPRTHTIDTNVADYIGWDGNVYFVLSSGPATSNYQCLLIDNLQFRPVYYPDTNMFCQTQTIAPITIANTGQSNLNMDGNFSAAFSGNDINLVLKVWQGTGSGCGAYGMGGWEKDCSVTGATTDLGTSTCRQFNSTNATSNGRLVTALAAGDSNQLCFSGDINAFTRRGTYVKTFQVGDFNS